MSESFINDSKGDVRDKLECTDLSKISIYSIDRDLEVGDIVYGYLTNPFKAKVSVIIPEYPFKVIGESESELFLLGQRSVFKYSWYEIFDLWLNRFYVHFLHNGKDHRFDAGLPDLEILRYCHSFENLKIRNVDKYCILDDLNGNIVEDKETALDVVPFVKVPKKKKSDEE